MSLNLASIYRRYLDCLNAQDWARLGAFVDEGAVHNGRPFGLAGYRALLERDFEQIPDLRFNAAFLITEEPYLSARLWFDCMPAGEFMGLPVNGRRVRFAEHVIYEFRKGRIVEVWSVIDKGQIEAQL
ncbi:MAG: ester cyclase [Alsobacter sp.]